MSIETKQFTRKPFHVDAVQVTEENMAEVAKWCKGRVQSTKKLEGGTHEHFIKVKVHRPLTERQTKAYVGDYVLWAPSNKGFKIYTPDAFKAGFAESVTAKLDSKVTITVNSDS